MLKIAICDDSLEFLSQLNTKINQWQTSAQSISVTVFCDGDALIRAHSAAHFDIIFLDIVMPLLNGIETAREIRNFDRSVKIVFLTSSPEYAVESYTVRADNYLLKPVTDSALFQCLDELRSEIGKSALSIVVRSAYASHRVELQRIEYIEAQNKHTLFSLTGGETLESIDPLYLHEAKLPPSEGFFKCHRSYIVNLNQIAQYTQNEVMLFSGSSVPISRSCHKEFQDAYFSTVFRKAGEGND
jgi:DNA-binding LytR/AlgR family response regulator